MIVTPTMKELTSKQCLCKKQPCTCIFTNGVKGHPTAVNLSNFAFSSDQEVLNHLALQAFLARQCSPTDLYVSPAWNSRAQSLEPTQVVSSSDQVVRQRTPSGRPRRKKENQDSSPVSPVPSDQNGRVQIQEKKFACDMCSRSFAYKHVLQNHKRTHTGEKPFECEVCQKKFTRGHHLTTHQRLHTGERPYECPICYKNFVQVANLRRHIRVHGERAQSPQEMKPEARPVIQPIKSHIRSLSPQDMEPGERPMIERIKSHIRSLSPHDMNPEERPMIERIKSHIRSISLQQIEPEVKPIIEPIISHTRSMISGVIFPSAPMQDEPEDLSIKRSSN